MTTKVRDAASVLRTVDQVKVRDAGGVLRTIDFIKVRDAGGVLREVYTSGGGGAANPASITPGSVSTSGSGASYTTVFTGMSSTTTPTVYAWGVVDGPGAVIAGGSTATATLRISGVTMGDIQTATFYCDMTIGGVVYRALCSITYERFGGGSL